MVYVRQAEPGRRDNIPTLLITEVKHLHGHVVVNKGQLYRLKNKETKYENELILKRVEKNNSNSMDRKENCSIYFLILQSMSIYLSLFWYCHGLMPGTGRSL